MRAADVTGLVLSIERGSLHDGPGIRTAVFLKGCPLTCPWCHNPESQAFRPELAAFAERCAACGACVAACPRGAPSVGADGHRIARDRCVACGACVAVCPHGALAIKGAVRRVADVMAVVVRDRPYYEASGGGLTLSGGEPAAQPAFCRALLEAARAERIQACLETSAATGADALLALAPLVDLFLVDWKESDPERHRRWTGMAQERVRDALRALAESGAAIRLRCPIVPGWNDREDHFAGIAALAASLPGLRGIEVMPYHALGASKSRRIGRDYPLPDVPGADAAQADAWRAALAARCAVPVR